MPRRVRTSWPTRSWSSRPSRPAAKRAPRSTVTTRWVTVTERSGVARGTAERMPRLRSAAVGPGEQLLHRLLRGGAVARHGHRLSVRDEPDVHAARRPSRPARAQRPRAREKRCISWQSDSPPAGRISYRSAGATANLKPHGLRADEPESRWPPLSPPRCPPRARSGQNGDTREALALFDSYRRLADVFHEVLSEQSLDALLKRIADTARRAHSPRRPRRLRGRRDHVQLWGVFARGALRRGGDRRRAVQLRPGHHRLGGGEPRARAGEQGRPRPARQVRRGHAARSRVADRRPAHRAWIDQGRAEHLPRRPRGVQRGGVQPRRSVRRRRCARTRQRPRARQPRAPGPDRPADGALEPPLLPRAAAQRDRPRLNRAGDIRGAADARPRRLQAGQRHLRACRRRPGTGGARDAAPRASSARQTTSAGPAARSSRSSSEPAISRLPMRSPSGSRGRSPRQTSSRRGLSRSRSGSPSAPSTRPTRASSSRARRSR